MIVKLFGLIREDKRNLIILILILVAVLLRCVILLLDWETLLMFIPDDSFYYFQLASNIISGHGSSMDGIHITNGYHPLWPIMISPFFLLKSIDPIIPVKLALFFSSLLTVISGYVFYKLIKQITNSKTIGIFAFALYVFNYYVIIIESIGEPAGISNLIIILLLYLTWQHANGKSFNYTQAIVFGALSGLAMLSRTDNVLLCFLFFMFGLFWFKPFRLSRFILSAMVSILVLLPWFIWNISNFHTIVQSSAMACPYIYHMNTEINIVNQLLSFDTKAWLELILQSNWVVRYGQMSYLFYLVFLTGLLALKSKDSNTRRGMLIAIIGFTLIIILFILHYAVAMYYREWHVAAAAPFVLMILIITIKHTVNIIPKMRWLWFLFGIFGFVMSIYLLYRLPNRTLFFWQQDVLEAKEWVLHNPKGTVAIYDGGVMQYLTDGWVLSIDGNVNNSAQQAVIDACVYDYMKQNGVEYLVGWSWIKKRYEKFWGADFDHSFVVIDTYKYPDHPPPIGSFTIWKLAR